MPATSSQRGLSVPTVSGDSGLWGSELNTTITDLDTILGATTIIQSSAGLSQTLTTSMAQTQRINVQGSPTGLVTLTFPSSLYANGLYSVWNTTASSLAFGVLCQTTGVGSNCTVPVNSQRLVQVDGTNAYFADQIPAPIFNFPPVLNGYISGMTLSNGGGNALNIGSGIVTDQSNATYMQFGGMTKSAGSLWVAGTGNGGMGNGLGFTPATWYNIFAISNSTNPNSSAVTSSSIDVYFDTSITAANKPTNTNFYRRIGSMLATSSAAVWASFSQNRDEFLWTTSVLDVNNATPSVASRTLYTLSVPPGVKVNALFRSAFGGAANELIFTSPDEADQAAAGANIDINATGQGFTLPMTRNVRTNVSGQIGARQNGTASVLSIGTYGWVDGRGRDGPP